MKLQRLILNGKKYVVLENKDLGGFIGTDRTWKIRRIEIAEDRGKDNPETWE